MSSFKRIAGERWFTGFSLSAVLLILLLFAVPSLTQGGFHPDAVMPRDCANGKMKCGYVPMKSAERQAVPDDPANMIRHRGLPSRVDLTDKMPPIGNQGRQGSCVGWASAYGMKSYQENVERNWGYGSHAQQGGPGAHVFSPAFVYNQINRGQDRGSNPNDALRLLQRSGAAPWKEMPYDANDYRQPPGAAAQSAAASYRIKSYTALRGVDAIKSQLAAGRVVFGGIKIYDNFYRLGNGIYDSGQGSFRGGHAILLVGYDNSKGFRIFNSWGTGWGNNGYGWISFNGWTNLGLAAFAVYDEVGGTPGPGKKEEPPVPVAPDNEKPQTPASITASQGSFPDQVYVSWTGVNGAAAYLVQRSEPTNPDSFGDIGNSQSTSFTDSRVQADVAYRYRVVAIGENGRSDPSYAVEGFARGQTKKIPPQVAGLNAVENSNGSVDISWNETDGAAHYEVIRYNFGQRKWEYVSRNVRGTATNDRRPVRNSKNYYRVRAVNRAGGGEWSEPAVASIAGKQTKPGQVTGLTATMGTFPDKIRLAWNSVPGAQGYGIYRYDPQRKVWEGPKTTTGTSFDDDHGSVKEGRPFAYTVMAFNGVGAGQPATPVAGFARAGTHRGVTLEPPKDVTGKIDASRKTITLNWKKVKGASEYYVFRKKEGQKEYKFVASAGNKTTYTEKIPGNPGEIYFYVIRSKSMMGGESTNSAAVSAFRNEERLVVKHRFFGNDGFDKFEGEWSATYWDGESAPVPMKLRIKRNGKNFLAELQTGSGRTQTFKGSFAAMSRTLKTDGFRMELSTGQDNAAGVRLERGNEELQVSFLKK